jgi:predicted CXXCH cytochrome family protein
MDRTPRISRGRGAGLFALALIPLFEIAPMTAWAKQGDRPPATAAGEEVSRTCAKECHKEILGHKVMHGPANSDCGACHVQIGDPKDHKFSFVVEREALCTRCHTLPHQNVMHKPVAEGRCMECHDPHGSEYRRVLKADPKRDLCLKCHKDQLTKGAFVHGPVAVGACIVCHQPHSSENPKLLIQDTKSLCLTCHAEVQAKGEQGVHMHGALEQGCTRCHDPHSSNHKFQLHDEAPALCMQCHKEKFDQIVKDNPVVHGAINVDGGCTKCHEPHSSRLASLQRGTQPGVCLKCHDTVLDGPNGSHITNMAELLAQNPDKHGPIREGACTACHNPHAGKHFRLLAEEYPPQFYAPFTLDTFKLCFKCHIPDLVLKPSAHGLTQFRDGDRNLHYVHVNQEKGRTCRACHEVHASKRPAHIREAVPFGASGWMLEINFEKTADGGSCAPGCHKPRTYSRLRGESSATPAGLSGASNGATPAAPGPASGPSSTGGSK